MEDPGDAVTLWISGGEGIQDRERFVPFPTSTTQFSFSLGFIQMFFSESLHAMNANEGVDDMTKKGFPSQEKRLQKLMASASQLLSSSQQS